MYFFALPYFLSFFHGFFFSFDESDFLDLLRISFLIDKVFLKSSHIYVYHNRPCTHLDTKMKLVHTCCHFK